MSPKTVAGWPRLPYEPNQFSRYGLDLQEAQIQVDALPLSIATLLDSWVIATSLAHHPCRTIR